LPRRRGKLGFGIGFSDYPFFATGPAWWFAAPRFTSQDSWIEAKRRRDLPVGLAPTFPKPEKAPLHRVRLREIVVQRQGAFGGGLPQRGDAPEPLVAQS